MLKNIRKTLEQMSENEAFMAAIQQDVLTGEEQAMEEEEMARIAEGHDPENVNESPNAQGRDQEEEDYEDDGAFEENQDSDIEF